MSSPERELSLDEVLGHVVSRFILHLPEEELESFERLFVQIEQAHWFYIDFYADKYSYLPKLKIRAFGERMFRSVPFLKPHLKQYDKLFERFRSYMNGVTVCGVILLDQTLSKALLVKGWGKGSTWTFPRGKINRDESHVDCAVREALEEIGFNAAGLVKEENMISMTKDGKTTRLYIVPAIDENTHFETLTRKEISDIQWFPLTDLNSMRKTWGVTPFVGRIFSWIKDNYGIDISGGSHTDQGGNKKGKKKKGKKKKNNDASVVETGTVSQSISFASLLSAASSQGSGSNLNNNSGGKKKSSRKGGKKQSKRGSAEQVSTSPSSPTRTYKEGSSVTYCDTETFGNNASQSNWSPEDMFRTNEQLFGVKNMVPDDMKPIHPVRDPRGASRHRRDKSSKGGKGKGQPSNTTTNKNRPRVQVQSRRERFNQDDTDSYATSYGNDSVTSWGAEQMFAANAQLAASKHKASTPINLSGASGSPTSAPIPAHDVNMIFRNGTHTPHTASAYSSNRSSLRSSAHSNRSSTASLLQFKFDADDIMSAWNTGDTDSGVVSVQ